MANTVPASTERTGTAVLPAPGSSASRVPTTAAGRSPAAATARTGRDGRVMPLRARACVAMATTATPISASMKARTPRPSTVQSADIPRSTSIRRTGPIGLAGEAATASRTARADPSEHRDARQHEGDGPDGARRGAEGAEDVVVGGLAADLPDQSLRDQRDGGGRRGGAEDGPGRAPPVAPLAGPAPRRRSGLGRRPRSPPAAGRRSAPGRPGCRRLRRGAPRGVHA